MASGPLAFKLTFWGGPPPLEAIKALLSLACSQCGRTRKIRKLAFIDIKKAYFHAPAQRLVYVQLPNEAFSSDQVNKFCGRLNFSLYGTRDAAQNWETEYTRVLLDLGFAQGKSSPCIFRCKSRDLSCVIHGDDFTLLGPHDQLNWFNRELSRKFQVKMF